MKANILITGAGGPAAISFLNAVRDVEGLNFFMGDIDPFAAGLYLVNDGNRIILPRGDDPHFAERLLRICWQNEIGILVPTCDAELKPLALRTKLFEQFGVKILVANVQTLQMCLDKDRLIERCRLSVPVPRSAILDADFDDTDWSYPLFVKPRSGSGSRGIMKIESPIELAQHVRDGRLLVQEYLPGAEYSVDVVADANGKILASVPRERLKVDSGIAVTSRTVKDDALQRCAEKVAALIGLRFTANIQFKRNAAGEPCLLEVNIRFPGTMPLTVASGVNMPRISLKALMGESIANEPTEWRETAVVRTWQEHFIEPVEIAELQAQAMSAEPIAIF